MKISDHDRMSVYICIVCLDYLKCPHRCKPIKFLVNTKLPLSHFESSREFYIYICTCSPGANPNTTSVHAEIGSPS